MYRLATCGTVPQSAAWWTTNLPTCGQPAPDDDLAVDDGFGVGGAWHARGMSETASPAAATAAVTPDTKDWTWVLDRPCPDCGFAAGALDPAELPRVILATTPTLAAALRTPTAQSRQVPGVWSPAEYVAHVVDVHEVMRERLRLILSAAGEPARFPNWDQDAAAIDHDYAGRSVPQLQRELTAAATAAAQAWMSPQGQQWQWPAERSNGSRFTTMTLGQYYAHDLVHHVWDVTGTQYR